MADWLDEASALTDMERQLALDKMKIKEDQPYVESEGDVECKECGDVIDPRRRKSTGSLMCHHCANYFAELRR